MRYNGYWDILRLCTVLGYLLALVEQIHGKECPPDAPQRAMQCVATFSGTRHGKENFLTEWDFDRIEEACSDGTFTRAITCAQDIINSCDDHPEQKEFLRKYLDMSRMTDGVNHLCTHQKTDIVNQIKCIQNQRPFVTKCAEAELAEFRTKISVLEGDMERILQAGCEFMQEVFNCQTSSVRRNCGARPAKQLSKIMSYFVPANCATNIDGVDRSFADDFAVMAKSSAHVLIWSCLSGLLAVKILNSFSFY